MRRLLAVALAFISISAVAMAKEITTLTTLDKRTSIRFLVPGACTSVDSLIVSDKPQDIFQCGPGNPVTVKQIPSFEDPALARIYRQESGLRAPARFKARHLPWGTLKTACTPASGATCFYFLKFNKRKLTLELFASQSVVVDFNQIKIDSQ